MKKTQSQVIILAILTIVLVLSCVKKKTADDADAPIRIMASTSIIGNIVSQIAGPHAALDILIPSGQSPHAWTPTPRDVIALDDADIIFVNGLGLETQLLSILDTLIGPVTVELSHGIKDIMRIIDHDTRHFGDATDDSGLSGHADTRHFGDATDDSGLSGHADPHLWLSPHNVMIWVQTIASTLSAADRQNAESYTVAANRYRALLDKLDEEVRNLTASIPPEHRKLVTDHNSFGYYARDYGFIVIDSIIPGGNDQAEPSGKHLNALYKKIEDDGIKAIFIDEASTRSIRRLTESIAKESTQHLPVVTLLTGYLAEPGQRGDDYLDLILYNTEKIVAALTADGGGD